jgi:hypothetical protein
VPDDTPRGRPALFFFDGVGGVMAAGSTSEPDTDVTCSAKGCQLPATWDLLWNNPKLHTPDRRKIWLACEEHKQSLSDFLGARGFLRDVQPH